MLEGLSWFQKREATSGGQRYLLSEMFYHWTVKGEGIKLSLRLPVAEVEPIGGSYRNFGKERKLLEPLKTGSASSFWVPLNRWPRKHIVSLCIYFF